MPRAPGAETRDENVMTDSMVYQGRPFEDLVVCERFADAIM